MTENNVTIEKLCQQIANIRNSSVVSFIIPEQSLKPYHSLITYDCIKNNKFEKLDVIIHCWGGDIGAAYQTIGMLRDRCSEMNIIVPIIATSAAALFILASNEIIMSEYAQFGPLDAQLGEPKEGERKYTSALNAFKTLEQIRTFAYLSADLTHDWLKGKTELSVETSVKYGIDFASKIVEPLMSQIDPEKLGEYSRALEIGKFYGDRLLKRYTNFDMTQRENILQTLIYLYPSHSYIIDFKELIDIGFKVIKPDDKLRDIVDQLRILILGIKENKIFLKDRATDNNPQSIHKDKVQSEVSENGNQ